MLHATGFFVTCVAFLFLAAVPVASFGAGSIPNYAYLNDKAFRHGDIEKILPSLLKDVTVAGEGGGGGGGLLGIILAALLSFGVRGRGSGKFSKMDAKRVYFGNWLRDFSQVMDIATLDRLTAQNILTLVSVLSFVTFGFATAEFEITPERLGVYLPVEHIDNPKGYAEEEGDARRFHPDLRPPLDPRELEINPHNGMKNYIATEGEAWDTSSGYIRRTLQSCIALGRAARRKGEDDLDQWEAFRHLGAALHTLEDLLAHSNWCELALRKLGHQDVFCHVGDAVLIDTPGGPAPPLVTGTFGGADFMQSALGEGMDFLSGVTVSNLVSRIEEAKDKGADHNSIIRSFLSRFFASTDFAHHHEKMEHVEEIKRRASESSFEEVTPEEIRRLVWHVLEWRDTLHRDVLRKIDFVPGLSEFFEEVMEALNEFVLTALDPLLKPIFQNVTDVLQDGSRIVIDMAHQYEVFDHPHASDPSHSTLAKDHFDLILNEPAGKVARVVVEYTVNMVVKAWCDEREDADAIIDSILEVLHHPYFATSNSEIQGKMMARLRRWFVSLGPIHAPRTLEALTKESVREGRNIRFADEPGPEASMGPDDDEHQPLGMHSLEGDVHEQTQPPPIVTDQKPKTEDLGIRYKIRPGRPTYERFDGQHRRRVIEEDEEPRYVVKPDEDFWKNPYADARRQNLHAASFGSTGYSSQARRHLPHSGIARPSSPTGYSYASTALLAEAESGFQSGLSQTSERLEKPWRRESWRRELWRQSWVHTEPSIEESVDSVPSYEEPGYSAYGGASTQPTEPAYGYTKGGGSGKGKSRDHMEPEDTESHRQQSHHRTASDFERYGSSSIQARERDDTTPRNDDPLEPPPPAFFVRVDTPEEISYRPSDYFDPLNAASGSRDDRGHGNAGSHGDEKKHHSKSMSGSHKHKQD